MPEPASTTTKTRDYLGRAVVTPTVDARDHLNRGCLPGDRDYLGRPLINGGTQTGPPASTATVDHLDPTASPAGQMAHVIVNGTGFKPGAQIEVIGVGVGANANLISATQVESNYLFPQTPGVYQVGVVNPGEQVSNTVPYTVT